MPIRASSVFQDRATGTSKRSANTIKVSPLLLQAADSDTDGVFQLLETSEQGLSETEAQNRLGKFGPNLVTQERQHTWIALLAKAVVNPLVILLLLLATISFATEDF